MARTISGETLDEICKGKLPAHLVQSIGEMEITARELEDWAQSRQPFYLGVKNGYLVLDLRIRSKLKKVLALTGGLISGALVLAELIIKVLPLVSNIGKSP